MKKQRQKALLDIIENQVIDTQEDLQKALETENFKVTQATVSRDIKELRIVKALDSEGRYRYVRGGGAKNGDVSSRYADIFSNSVTSIKSALNDVIIKCHTGAASGACAAIDMMFGDELLGTIAGDDTILAITEDEESAAALVGKLTKLL